MRTLSKILFSTVLLLAASTHCFAETMNSDVSEEQAKAIGVTMEFRENGDAGVKVSLNFKTKGAMKEFAGAELRVTAKDKYLVSAPLKISRSDPDSVTVSFSIDPGSLANSEFWIYVDDTPKGGKAYRFKLKDFSETS